MSDFSQNTLYNQIPSNESLLCSKTAFQMGFPECCSPFSLLSPSASSQENRVASRHEAREEGQLRRGGGQGGAQGEIGEVVR